jgi:transcriptional regulator of met regulon
LTTFLKKILQHIPLTNLRISLNRRTRPQVEITAWYPKNDKQLSALRAGSDNTAG